MPDVRTSSEPSRWRALGPGILFAATAIGVSHLVQSTRAGALYGLAMVGVVVVANASKYPALRFGPEYTAATGHSLLEGYRRQGRWTLWVYALLTLATMFTVQAAVTVTTAGLAIALFAVPGGALGVSAAVLAAVAAVLYSGHYRVLDSVGKVLVGILTVSTLAATAIALPRVDFSGPLWPQAGQLDAGTLFFMAALAGWMPAPIDVSVWQGLWGLAKEREAMRRTGVRAAVFDFNVGFFGTAALALCFVVMGAGVMHGAGISFADSAGGFAAQVIDLYARTLGEWSRFVVGLSALAVMFSTTLTVADGFPRAVSVLIMRLSHPEDEQPIDPEEPRQKALYRISFLVLAAGALAVLGLFMTNLTQMADVATIASFLTAPVLAFLNHRAITSREVPLALRPAPWLVAFSWAGIVTLSAFALFYLGLQAFGG